MRLRLRFYLLLVLAAGAGLSVFLETMLARQASPADGPYPMGIPVPLDEHWLPLQSERELDEAAAAEAARAAAMIRARGWDALRSRVKEEKYLNHSVAVEAMMRQMAAVTGDDENEWGLAGLLHDIDIAVTAENPSQHGAEGTRILHELGFSDAVVKAVRAHDDRSGIARASRLDHALYCADQIYWLMASTGLEFSADTLDAAVPVDLLRQVHAMSAKREVLERVSRECAQIGLSTAQAFEASLAGLRRAFRASGSAQRRAP